MHIRSSEVHTRHAYIERSIAGALEILRTTETMRRLGEQALSLANIMENQFYPATIRHGKIIAPRRLDDERVPVVALREGERLRADSKLQLQTPMQTELSEDYINLTGSGRVQRQFDKRRRGSKLAYRNRVLSMPVHGRADSDAYVSSGIFGLPALTRGSDGLMPYFISRPLMTLMMKDDEELCKSPDIITHETQHVFDDLHEPVFMSGNAEYNWRRQLRHELKAYFVQSRCIEAMALVDYTPAKHEHSSYTVADDRTAVYSIPHALMNAMRENPGDDDTDFFMPNDALVERLRSLGLDSIAVQPSK